MDSSSTPATTPEQVSQIIEKEQILGIVREIYAQLTWYYPLLCNSDPEFKKAESMTVIDHDAPPAPQPSRLVSRLSSWWRRNFEPADQMPPSPYVTRQITCWQVAYLPSDGSKGGTVIALEAATGDLYGGTHGGWFQIIDTRWLCSLAYPQLFQILARIIADGRLIEQHIEFDAIVAGGEGEG